MPTDNTMENQPMSYFADSLSISFGSGGMVRSSGDLPFLDDGSGGYSDVFPFDDQLLWNSSNSTQQNTGFVFLAGWAIPVAIAIGLLIISTICGNALVILSVLLVKRIRTPYNLLIVSLATTDLGTQ